ncbi:hypothetical protein GCM10007916_03690 [Psychromonas marina]|uniref:Uncharacterized protein n=1 Tax=Psychromonas marina TaxID=88364 RepID=A0ABQ6DW08_9GAMM|nr:hypothetical protein GCM10007916_03690 [Psychromonas marina]
MGDNLLLNPGFEVNIDGWLLPTEAKIMAGSNTNQSSFLLMQATYIEDNGYNNQIQASQCVAIGNAEEFEVRADFNYQKSPIIAYGHRLNLVWYEGGKCDQGGQYGTYLQPKKTLGWQTLHDGSIKAALNAKSVQLTLVQNQRTSAIELSLLEKWWSELLSFFGFFYAPELAQGAWDNITLIPTKLVKNTPAELRFSSEYSLPRGDNYLKNPSFDSKAHWRVWHGGQWVANEEGTNHGALKTSLSSKTNSLGTGAFSQCINLGRGDVFETGIRFKADPESSQTGGGRIRVSWYQDLNCKGRYTTSGRHADPKVIEGWQELHVPELIPAKGARSVVVSVIKSIHGPGQHSAFWDDAYFRESKK